jgi:hypothetical protein
MRVDDGVDISSVAGGYSVKETLDSVAMFDADKNYAVTFESLFLVDR